MILRAFLLPLHYLFRQINELIEKLNSIQEGQTEQMHELRAENQKLKVVLKSFVNSFDEGMIFNFLTLKTIQGKARISRSFSKRSDEAKGRHRSRKTKTAISERIKESIKD